MSRTIRLLPEFETSLDRLVECGRYGDVNDVLMYAIAALEDRDVALNARKASLLAHIQEGLDDIEAGRTRSVKDIFAELDEIIGQHEVAQAAAVGRLEYPLGHGRT